MANWRGPPRRAFAVEPGGAQRVRIRGTAARPQLRPRPAAARGERAAHGRHVVRQAHEVLLKTGFAAEALHWGAAVPCYRQSWGRRDRRVRLGCSPTHPGCRGLRCPGRRRGRRRPQPDEPSARCRCSMGAGYRLRAGNAVSCSSPASCRASTPLAGVLGLWWAGGGDGLGQRCSWDWPQQSRLPAENGRGAR